MHSFDLFPCGKKSLGNCKSCFIFLFFLRIMSFPGLIALIAHFCYCCANMCANIIQYSRHVKGLEDICLLTQDATGSDSTSFQRFSGHYTPQVATRQFSVSYINELSLNEPRTDLPTLFFFLTSPDMHVHNVKSRRFLILANCGERLCRETGTTYVFGIRQQ